MSSILSASPSWRRGLKSDEQTSCPRRWTRRANALFNNLTQNEELALRIDETVKKVRPDDWRGVQPKERVIKAALYGVLQDPAEVERIFLIIKAQKEY
jgi:hypothetical protein